MIDLGSIDLGALVTGIVLLLLLSFAVAVCLALLFNHYCKEKFGISLAAINAESIKQTLARFNAIPGTVNEANRRAKEALDKIQSALDSVDSFQVHLDNKHEETGKIVAPLAPQIKRLSDEVKVLQAKVDELSAKQHDRLGVMRNTIIGFEKSLAGLKAVEIKALNHVEEGPDLPVDVPVDDDVSSSDSFATTLTYVSPGRQTGHIKGGDDNQTSQSQAPPTARLSPEEVSAEYVPTVKMQAVKSEDQIIVGAGGGTDAELRKQALMKTEVSLPSLKHPEEPDDPMKTVVGMKLVITKNSI